MIGDSIEQRNLAHAGIAKRVRIATDPVLVTERTPTEIFDPGAARAQ